MQLNVNLTLLWNEQLSRMLFFFKKTDDDEEKYKQKDEFEDWLEMM